MEVEIHPSAAEVARRAADLLGEVVETVPDAVVAWATGRTFIPFYGELAARRGSGPDLGRVRGFNLDELLLPAGDPRSFAAYMERHAWERIGLDRRRCEVPRPDADPASECERYDRAIAAAGGLDLALLGVGEDGHVAYNLPGPRRGTTHVVELADEVADRLGVPAAERPLRAVTMGMDAIENAGRIVLLATGASKRPAVAALVDGPEDPQWPCSWLREHSDLRVLVDERAAGGAP